MTHFNPLQGHQLEPTHAGNGLYHSHCVGVLRLWQDVLWTVVSDLCSQSSSDERKDAERWIGDFPSRDFKEVCARAGFDPEAVWPRLKQIAQMAPEHRPVLNGRNGKTETISHQNTYGRAA